ncbi:hypothetical protein [Duganella callida]|uniref:Uncharacterized protein n=1 Tax=Duganella callida TaxID=2561932 RepID=A0A4Y9S4S6_9BURK|nr:hypothetical protein [Duganella callida]TFW16346.1 hypothetical protein E4L98_24080 [Duganella callida]
MKIFKAIESAPSEIAMNALGYSVLMLEQSELPKHWKRQIYYDYLFRGLEPEVIALGRKILAEIEETERADLDHLPQQTRDRYTVLFGRIDREIYAAKKSHDTSGLTAALAETGAALP